MITAQERFQGCLLGLAVGDALGTSLECKAPGTFSPVQDMVGGGPFNLAKGQWTDDTSMALCLAESLISCRSFDVRDQMERYIRWWQEGHLSSIGRCFGIGNTVAGALQQYSQTGDPLAGSTDPRTAGNGSLMRLAPVPMFYAAEPENALRMCGDSSKTTHGAVSCIDACRYYGGLIVGALRGVEKEHLLSPCYTPVAGIWQQKQLCPEVEEIARGSYKRKSPPEVVGSGYVVKSLEAALWAFTNSTSFAEGALLAVNLGNDADTTGAVYGQLAGAWYGEMAIPDAWRSCLAHLNLIKFMARELSTDYLKSSKKF